MQDKANKDLFDLISALSGNSDFTPAEISQLLALANRRFFEAYNRTPYWARYLTVGEERTIANSIVPFTQTSKTTIGEFLRIHREEPFLRNSTIDFEFFVESDGAHVINLTSSDATSVYVTYRKPITLLTTLDNAGTGGEQEVPQEYFYFMAHATYADFLRMDGQHSKAAFEEDIANNYLAESLDNPQQVYNNNTVGHRIKTYVSQQSR
ncbi:hypothetical protein [Planktomarina sp.]|uniref:hypothetical protein n=1 Tax=Planktomarina sp. TaxID=2024851 RepID=UPI003260DEFF